MPSQINKGRHHLDFLFVSSQIAYITNLRAWCVYYSNQVWEFWVFV